MPNCEECGKEFNSDQGLSDHKDHAHLNMTSHERKEMKRRAQQGIKASDYHKQKNLGRMKAVAMVVAIVVVIGGLVYAALNAPTQPRIGPTAADHWHADYTVTLCGDVKPDLPPSEGGVHSHGDGLIHIHPHTDDELYEKANLRLFFQNSGVTLNEDGISGEPYGTFTDGDVCVNSTAPGMLKLVVNDVDTKSISTYVPMDGDVVEIIFE